MCAQYGEGPAVRIDSPISATLLIIAAVIMGLGFWLRRK
jgi:hypothetical protein